MSLGLIMKILYIGLVVSLVSFVPAGIFMGDSTQKKNLESLSTSEVGTFTDVQGSLSFMTTVATIASTFWGLLTFDVPLLSGMFSSWLGWALGIVAWAFIFILFWAGVSLIRGVSS